MRPFPGVSVSMKLTVVPMKGRGGDRGEDYYPAGSLSKRFLFVK